MVEVSTIGLDIAKNVFQVHGTDAAGEVTIRRQLRRGEVLKFFSKLPRCLVGMESCGTANYWAREIAKLGHEVRLMPPIRVKAYVRQGAKNDSADAAACNEAVTRPSMKCVPIKSVEQQAVLMLHRVRQLLVEQRTRLSNAIRAHLAEFGVIAKKGDAGFAALLNMIALEGEERVPDLIRPILAALVSQWRSAGDQLVQIERQILAWHKSNEASQRLASIPQFGPIISTAMVASAGDAARFKNGRQFSAWIGLVPRQNSSGGRTSLGPITKAGDKYLRQLLVTGATGMIRRVKQDPSVSPWLADLLTRMPAKKAAIALANKMARIAWALLVKHQSYQSPLAA